MNRNTKIEWTDMTWNPIIGCHKISPGCDHCYAEKMANRISHMNSWIGEQYREVIDIEGKWNWNTHVADSHMDFPRTLKKPRKIFVGSMTDIFLHSQSKQGMEDVARLFSVFAQNPQHTFQILTKRPHAMKIFFDNYTVGVVNFLKNGVSYLPNVWLGTTVCNQKEADFNIPILLDTPAAKRFISVEPMLGPIVYNLDRLDWVIIGGETGQSARPLQHSWVQSLVKQAQLCKIPVFFKKWGTGSKIVDSQIESLKQFPK
jgi:protein gp37